MLASVPLFGEAHTLEGGKARAKQSRELALLFPDGSKIQSAIDSGVQGGLDARFGMTEEPRRILAAEVDVAVLVHVLQQAALAARHCRWKGRIEQDRAGVAARQNTACALVYPSTLGAGHGI
jgi:hypothetical protein